MSNTAISNKTQIIGLTGGIATGKTTVTNYIQNKYNLPIIDADLLAREAVQQNSPILEQIFQRYGNKIKLPNGELDRKALGNIIFNNPQEKAWLEAQIHPYVRAEILKAIAQSPLLRIILDIPLLFEANMTDLVTEIWLVTCTEQQQKQRLMHRNNLTRMEAEVRVKNQLSLDIKAKYANIILDNSHTLDHLYQQIDNALNK
jgi:dephospho-CoA kinase